MLEATAITVKDSLGVIGTATIVAIAHAVTEWRNKNKAKSGQSALARIEQKIDANHLENRETCRLLSLRLDDVEILAEDALSQVIGPAPDRKNGVKSRVADLERWQEAEALRERHRLEQLERDRELDLRLGPDRRVPKPTDVGTLTPRTT